MENLISLGFDLFILFVVSLIAASPVYLVVYFIIKSLSGNTKRKQEERRRQEEEAVNYNGWLNSLPVEEQMVELQKRQARELERLNNAMYMRGKSRFFDQKYK